MNKELDIKEAKAILRELRAKKSKLQVQIERQKQYIEDLESGKLDGAYNENEE